jgi:hypothetical protein
MVRISKQAERRSKCPHRPRPPAPKTGPKAEKAFKPHVNTLSNAEIAKRTFIPKMS